MEVTKWLKPSDSVSRYTVDTADTELAFDGWVKQGKVPYPTLDLELRPDRPDVLYHVYISKWISK